MLNQEIDTLMGTFKHNNQTQVIEDYQGNSFWLDFVHI